MPHRLHHPARVRVTVAALVLCSTSVLLPAVPAGADPPAYRPPVDAPVIDPFRPPEHRYGPGNRGIDYGTAPGTEVHAAAAGRVTFAGAVAGSRHVTVLHGDGIRTTYSYLDRIDVLVGQRVGAGDVVGTTVGTLHLSARSGDSYFDPASLFADGPPRVHLVPFDEPPGAGPAGERSAIGQLLGGIGGAIGRAAGTVVDLTTEGMAWLQAKSPQLLRTAMHYALYAHPVGRAYAFGRAVASAWAASHRPCTSRWAPVSPPRGRRVAVLVAGLASTSEPTTGIDDLDVDDLGYEREDVLRFSYAGGRIPHRGGSFPGTDVSTYTKLDSQQDLVESGRRLADLLEDVLASAPGVPVDVIAHSQGGLVARLALLELEERHGTAWLERFGLVATLGTPHQGADAATAAHAFADAPLGKSILANVEGIFGYDPHASTVHQLAETSDVVLRLRDRGVPEPIELLSIAARGDLVVPVPRTEVPGATHAVVGGIGPSAHGDLPGGEAAERELLLGLTGAPPTCTSFGTALLDHMVGAAISVAEDAVGNAL